jgi:hypothetical protein
MEGVGNLMRNKKFIFIKEEMILIMNYMKVGS